MPMDDPTHDPDSIREENQKALIWVSEERGNYAAIILTGTPAVLAEIKQTSNDAVDHEHLKKSYPRRRGLHIFEGTLLYHNGREEFPDWQGTWRNMTPQDFTDLDV